MELPFKPFTFGWKKAIEDESQKPLEEKTLHPALDLNEVQRRDRLLRIFSSDAGDALLREVAERIDKLIATAARPEIASNTHNTAHALGGVFALRELMNELQGIALAHAQQAEKDKKKKNLS